MSLKKATVIGAGISGCMYAWALQQKGWNVTVIEKAPFTGGGCRTFTYAGHPYTWGPRHFLSPHPEAYDFLNKVVPLRDLKKINYNYQDDIDTFFTYPPHEDDIDKLPEANQVRQELIDRTEVADGTNYEEFYIQRMGPTIYKRFNEGFNKKAWMLESNAEMDFGISATVKRHALESGERHEFKDWYNCYPIAAEGYNKWFDYLLDGCNVRLNSNIETFDINNSTVVLDDGETIRSDIMVSTISPDLLMNFAYGELRYMGRDCHFMVLPGEYIFPKNVYFIYYPNPETQITRLVEYKQFTQHKSPNSLIVIEIPSTKNKLYPMLIKSEVDKAQKYTDSLPENVFSVGRMGTYRYINMSDIIMAGLEFKKQM